MALEIAIRALELEGEVIVPSFTFVATAHALWWQGIRPVFCDIDPATHCLDPAAVERHLTPRTTGILGVHLWGRACDVEGLEALAGRHGLKLLFDAAHAFGVSHRGRMIGSFGRCEVLSFHATKFFNALEGGAIVTNDGELAAKTRLMRNFGFSRPRQRDLHRHQRQDDRSVGGDGADQPGFARLPCSTPTAATTWLTATRSGRSPACAW